MKRGTKVHKPESGEQEPFSRQLAQARKENLRLLHEHKSRVAGLKRKHESELDAAHANLSKALADYETAVNDDVEFRRAHHDFARVAPVLRSRSFFRRLWWGMRFAAWGVFRYEVGA